MASRAVYVDHVAAPEIALDRPNAGGEQASLSLGHRPRGAVVDVEIARAVGEERDPLLFVFKRALCLKKRAASLARDGAKDCIAIGARRDERRYARAGCDLRGGELCFHPAGRGRFELGCYMFDLLDESGVFIFRRVGGVETVDVGEYHEKACVEHRRDVRTECVVVAELEFLDGDGVVLVDNGYGAFFYEQFERIEGVRVAAAVGEISAGDEKLSRVVAALAEEAVVFLHEKSLTAGGARLFRRDGGGTRAVAEASPAGGDRAGGDDGDGVTRVAKVGDLADDVLYFVRIEGGICADE